MNELAKKFNSIIGDIEDNAEELSSNISEILENLNKVFNILNINADAIQCPFTFGLEENVDCRYLKSSGRCGNIVENATKHDAWCRKSIVDSLEMKIKLKEVLTKWI